MTYMLILPSETSMSEVLLELAQEGDVAMVGGDQILMHKVSLVHFLKQGLDLKEQQ